MKPVKIIFLLASVVMLIHSNAQNLISNGSFENCKQHVSCTSGEGHFDQVADWGSFGSGLHFGTSSTPDWFEDISAPDGTHVAGIFENEGIFYDIGSSGFKTSIYHLSFYAKGYDDNATLNISPVNGVSCFLSTVPPSELNCTDFAGGDVYLLDKRSLSTSGTWTHIELDFPVYNGVVPYLATWFLVHIEMANVTVMYNLMMLVSKMPAVLNL